MWSLKHLVGNPWFTVIPCRRNCFLFHPLPRHNQYRLEVIDPQLRKKRHFSTERKQNANCGELNVSSFLQFELQWMLIHCDPKRAQRESCNELPATEVQLGKGFYPQCLWWLVLYSCIQFKIQGNTISTQNKKATKNTSCVKAETVAGV